MNSKRQASGAAADLDAAIAEVTATAAAEEKTGQGDSKKARVDAD
jgi:hypothetical protein